MEPQNQIVIYQSEDNQTQIEVRLEADTVWLPQKMMAELFQTSKQNISLHIQRIYDEQELLPEATVKEYLTVQKEGKRNVERLLDFYNLDMIISVGYRIKSKVATKFRQWATQRLKDYLVQGFALNEKLLNTRQEKLNQLNDAINVISTISSSKFLETAEKDSFLMLLNRYSVALNLLDDYDYNRINKPAGAFETAHRLEYEEVKEIIQKMKDELGNSEYFGKEKDESLKSSIAAIYQTFGGEDLYLLIFEKAANLLYFLVKNHSFVDGNKRIAAAVFLYFLEKNDILSKSNLDNELLVALTLMIANSKPSDKEIIINIVSIILKK